MKSVLIMAALVLYASGVLAVGQEGASEPKKDPKQQEVKKEDHQQEITKESKLPEWPRPYKPTEEINADSVVPFPADI
jgi:hypothetical protein